jgi:hypothetical protein
MLKLQLYIKNRDISTLYQQIELFDDESVQLTQSIQDVRDIEKVFTDYTKTFDVPASKNNNKIFKHFYNYNILDFDARRKFDAILHLNHKPFKKGKIKLEGSTLRLNKPHTYKLTFFGSTVNLPDLVGDDYLSALKMITSDFTFTYSDANIKTYLSDGLDITSKLETYTDAIIFPLISHTKRFIYDTSDSSDNTATQNNIAYEAGTAHGLELSQLKPALRIYPIIKAIEFQYGIEFSEDFFNTTNPQFYNLYLWLHNKTGGLFEDEGNIATVGDFEVTYTNGDVVDLRNNYFTTPPPDQSTGRAKKERLLDVTVVPSNDTVEYNFVIFENGNVFQRYDGLTGEYAEIRELPLNTGDYSFGIETDTPSTYDIRFYVQRKRRVSGTADIHFTGTASILSDVTLNISNQLPEIKVIDFLTGLFKMFNLTAFQNEQGILVVKTLDEFYNRSDKKWDITQNLDKESLMVDSVLPFKQIDFTYEGLDNFFAKNHKELFNVGWGENRFQASAKFEGETYTVKLPFEHFKYERLVNVADGNNTDTQWGWSADIKQQPNLGKPLLFYPILKTQQIGVIDSNGTLTSQSSIYIPSNSVATTQTSITGTDESENINFNAEKNEFTNIPYQKTLFDQYYKKYVTEIFDKQRRLTTVKAYLPIKMLHNLSLADKVIIFDRLYKINKITTNFENNLSTLELINIKEEVVGVIEEKTQEIQPVIPLKFTPEVDCYTTDSTELTADSTLIKGDITCGAGELPIVTFDEEVPADTAISNIPQVVDEPLVVTIATISTPDVDQLTNNSSTAVTLRGKIDELGEIGETPSLDEYGFIYSSTYNDLVGDDLDAIIGTSGVTQHRITDDKTEGEKLLELTGLTHPSVIYYRFYTRTNTDEEFDQADALTTITSSDTVPASPYTETATSVNYVISTTADNPADVIRTVRIKTDDGDFVDYVTSGAFEIQSKIVPYVVEGIPIPSGAITTQYNVTSNGLSSMLETQMSIPATINGTKVNSGVGFAYSATSRVDAENDSQVFASSSIPFKDVAIPSGTSNINFSTTSQNYNLFYNEGTAVYTNWNDERKSDFGFINGTATTSTETKATVPDGYYAQWGWNSDGTAQNIQPAKLNCGFSVHVVNGVIKDRRQFGSCQVIPREIPFSCRFAAIGDPTDPYDYNPSPFEEIPAFNDLYVLQGGGVQNPEQYGCGDIVTLGGPFYHSGVEEYPEIGDKVKLGSKRTYDGGINSFNSLNVYRSPFNKTLAPYMALAYGEKITPCPQNICRDGRILGFIIIETATSTVVQKYECP